MDLIKASITSKCLLAFCEASDIDMTVPFKELEEHPKKSYFTWWN